MNLEQFFKGSKYSEEECQSIAKNLLTFKTDIFIKNFDDGTPVPYVSHVKLKLPTALSLIEKIKKLYLTGHDVPTYRFIALGSAIFCAYKLATLYAA